MKRIFRNALAAFAVLAGIIIGAVCSGILACFVGIALAWGGAVTLIGQNTDWITNHGGK